MPKFMIFIIAIVIVIPLSARIGIAAPTIKVLPTTQSIEKGGVFQIRVEISTNETIDNILIVPIVPDGFVVDPIIMPGIETSQKESTIRIERLETGSSITVSFKAWPPGFTGKPKRGEKEAPYYTRGESKSFVFNVFYTIQNGKVTASQISSINIRYTTSIGFYLIAGLLGIIIGHIVKTGTQNRAEIISVVERHETKTSKLLNIFGYIFVSRLPALLTILAVGFGALLALSKESIPVTSWHQAIALGIGLSILTDEQLLAKLKA